MKNPLRVILVLSLIFALGCDSKRSDSSTLNLPEHFLASPNLTLTYEFYEDDQPAGRDIKTSVIKGGNLHLLYQDGTAQEFKESNGQILSRFTHAGSNDPYELFFDDEILLGSNWESEGGVIARIIHIGEHEIFNKKRKYFDLEVTYPPKSISAEQVEASIYIERYSEGLGYIESRSLDGKIDEKLILVETENKHNKSGDDNSE